MCERGQREKRGGDKKKKVKNQKTLKREGRKEGREERRKEGGEVITASLPLGYTKC